MQLRWTSSPAVNIGKVEWEELEERRASTLAKVEDIKGVNTTQSNVEGDCLCRDDDAPLYPTNMSIPDCKGFLSYLHSLPISFDEIHIATQVVFLAV